MSIQSVSKSKFDFVTIILTNGILIFSKCPISIPCEKCAVKVSICQALSFCYWKVLWLYTKIMQRASFHYHNKEGGAFLSKIFSGFEAAAIADTDL